MKIQTNNTNPKIGTSAYFIWKACRDLGHTALLANEYDTSADMVINVDGSKHVDEIPGKPFIFWDTDSFYHGPPEKNIWTRLFIGGCPEDLAKYPKGSIYLPHAFDEDLHRPVEINRKADVVFVGNHSPLYQERNEMIDRLKKLFDVSDTETKFDISYTIAMNRGRLIFNRSLGKKNIPMRFFEGMAIGALLQNYNDNLDELATPHEHYIPYTDEEDLIKQIRYYLDHPEKRMKLAKNARKHALKHHTYKHRVKTILSYI